MVPGPIRRHAKHKSGYWDNRAVMALGYLHVQYCKLGYFPKSV